MSSTYWDPYSSGGTSTSSFWGNDLDSTASTTPIIPSWYFNQIVVTRKILVEMPDGWTEDMCLGFVRLVNIDTQTGWKVTLLIKGNILVTDPTVEQRSLVDFIPLLKDRASKREIDIINDFFEKNPIKRP